MFIDSIKNRIRDRFRGKDDEDSGDIDDIRNNAANPADDDSEGNSGKRSLFKSVKNRIRHPFKGKAGEDDGDIDDIRNNAANPADDDSEDNSGKRSLFKSVKNRIRHPFKGKNKEDDGDIDNTKEKSFFKSIAKQVRGRFKRNGNSNEDNTSKQEELIAGGLGNNKGVIDEPTSDDTNQKSSNAKKLRRLWGKKPAQADNKPEPKDLLAIEKEIEVAEPKGLPAGRENPDISEPKDLLTVQNGSGDDKATQQSPGNNESLPQPQGEAIESDANDSVEAKEEKEEKETSDLLSSLFKKDTEDDVSPIDALVSSLPDVEIGELIDETKEVKALIRRWHQNVMSK